MQISDQELILQLKSYVKEERQMLMGILRHLREVERRELFLERGYSSMFVFCVEELGYSHPEAQVRIQAMRLMTTVSGVEQKLERGQLSLSVAAKVQSCARKEKLNEEQKRTLVENLSGTSTREAERKIATLFPLQANKEKEKPINEQLTRIEFNASNELLQKFRQLKNLLGHENFEGRYDLLFEKLADIALEKLNAPILRARVVPPHHTRYIPKSTKHFVRTRAQQQCQYIDPQTKRRCNSTHALQIDHIKEFSKGGGRELENLQLLCGAHNRWKSAVG